MVELRQSDGGAREQEVTGEHGRLRREELVDSGASAARVGAIEHVVVHERCCVDHLGDRRQLAVLNVSCCCLLLA